MTSTILSRSKPPLQSFFPAAFPDIQGGHTGGVEGAAGFRGAYKAPMPGFVAYPLPIPRPERQFKLKSGRVDPQPLECRGPLKERVIVRFGIALIADIENPAGLMF